MCLIIEFGFVENHFIMKMLLALQHRLNRWEITLTNENTGMDVCCNCHKEHLLSHDVDLN